VSWIRDGLTSRSALPSMFFAAQLLVCFKTSVSPTMLQMTYDHLKSQVFPFEWLPCALLCSLTVESAYEDLLQTGQLLRIGEAFLCLTVNSSVRTNQVQHPQRIGGIRVAKISQSVSL
jgi:hypothetical protein